MLHLYDTNFYVELLTNRTINPILGTTGVVPVCEPDSVVKGIVDDFWTLNELDTLDAQERTLRDFLILGEVFDLVAPHDGSFLMSPVLSQTVSQTVLDPANYHQIIGVKRLVGAFEDYDYNPIVTNERRLSHQAKSLREEWLYPQMDKGARRQHCDVHAFLWQNLKKTAPIPAPSVMSFEQLQKRGEPMMFTASDLFKATLDYLWTSIDRIKALNTFNWMFKLRTPEDQRLTTDEKIDIVTKWKRKIGTPKPNSAIFFSDEFDVTPANFPAGVASGIEGLYKVLRNTSGWAGNSRDEDMGDSDSRFASMRQPGITNPTVETLQNVQTKNISYRRRQLNYILHRKYDEGVIPNREVVMVRGKPTFQLEFHAPKISTQDIAQAMSALKTFEESWGLLRQQGRYTPESLDAGEQKIINELMSIDLEVAPEPVVIQHGTDDTK